MLQPYTVLDFTDDRGELGPMLLGDLGADVIRVELAAGSAARRTSPQIADAADNTLNSLSFCAFNRNKRSIVLDPQLAADQQALAELIRRCDFIFESYPDSTLAEFSHDFASAKALNPNIVYVRLSPFGADGPHADFLGNDLVIAAMGGPVGLQGYPDRAPVRLSVPQVWRHAGVEAAAGALVAHHKMLRSGGARYVDLSAQCVMTWTMLNAMDAYAIQGADFERGAGRFNAGGVQFDIVYPTADGHVVALPVSNVILGCLPLMIEEGIADESLYDIDWPAYDLNMANAEHKPLNINQGADLCRAFFKNRGKQELYELGLEKGMTLAPVNTLEELLALQHMQTREYWQPLQVNQTTAAAATTLRSPGLWAKTSVPTMSVRRAAPALGEHSEQIRQELASAAPSKTYPAPEQDDTLPFAGVTVADFAWVGVGPISAKYLADHGAHVIRIESESRPDVLRNNGPFKDGEPGLDRSQFFGDFNTSKQSLTLNMKSPEAIEIAKQVITRADVMIESFAPGAVTRMGLGYEEVRKLNPSLIMISTCLMGQTGPASQLAGYGYHAGAMAGFYDVLGWPDRAPTGPWVAYTDTIAPRFISVLLAAALDHRRRTGEGCFMDVAQIEASLHFLGPELLDLQANGVAASRNGNRSTTMAPQGCYQTKGEDNWCAIAVETDDQWQTLCRCMARADLAADEKLAHHSGRLAAHDEIDAAIADWVRPLAATQVMQTLQAAGVPAGVVQRSSDLLADPQYKHREFYRYLEHAVMGRVPYAGHQYRISEYDNGPRAPAPALGADSFQILSEFLGMEDTGIGEAYASGAVS